MSKSSHFDYQLKLVIRRMAGGAGLRLIQNHRFRLGKNTLIDKEVVDKMVATGRLLKGGKGWYYLDHSNLKENHG